MASRLKRITKKAEEELKIYEKTNDFDHLAQGGEKIWLAYNLLIEKIINKKINRFSQLKSAVISLSIDDDFIFETFRKAYQLHKFFYREWTENEREIERLAANTLKSLEVLKKSYGVKEN